MKKILHFIVGVALCAMAAAQPSANDLLFQQRNSSNTAYVNRYITPVANQVLYTNSSNAPALSASVSGQASKFLRGDLTWVAVPGGGDMLSSNNLSDVANVVTSRSNLGFKTILSGSHLILQVEGDSLSDPAGTSGTTSTQTWPYYLTHTFSWASGASAYYNCATGGATYATVAARYAASVYPHRPGAGQQTLLFIWFGHNDLFFGDSPATLYTNLKAYWAQARLDGFTIVAFTVTNGSSVNPDAYNTAVHDTNELIRSDPSLYDFLVDTGASFPANTDTTYFQSASQHLNAYGNQRIAGEVNRVVFQTTTVTYQPQTAESMARMIVSPYALFKSWGWVDGSNNTTMVTTANGNLIFQPAGTGYTYAKGNPFFGDKIVAGTTTIPSAHNTSTNLLMAGATQNNVIALVFNNQSTGTSSWRMAVLDGTSTWQYASVNLDVANSRMRITADDFGGGARIDLARGATAGITYVPNGLGQHNFTNAIISTDYVQGTRFGSTGNGSTNAGFFNNYAAGSGFQENAAHSSTGGFSQFDAYLQLAASTSFTAATAFDARENAANGSTVTTQTGFHAAALSFGATIYGFRGQVNTIGGKTTYNLFMEGTADNYISSGWIGAVISTPSAPAASQGRVYFDTSGGKVRFMARFPTGAAQVIATEP